MAFREALFVVAFGIASAGAADAQSASADLVKRGDYLVNGILTCGNCHSPKGPTGDIPARSFPAGSPGTSRRSRSRRPTSRRTRRPASAARPTPRSTVMRKGIKKNGVPIAMIMPSGFYES